MKGTAFASLRDVVVERAGEDAWDDVLDRTGLPGTWTTLGTYDDGEFAAVAAGAAEVLQAPQAELLRAAGARGVRLVLEQQPELSSRYPDALAALGALDVLYRSEVRKVDPTATPVLRSVVTDEWSVGLDFRAPYPQCRVLEGTVLGIGAFYDVAVSVEQVACVADAGDRCLLRVRLDGPATDGTAPDGAGA